MKNRITNTYFLRALCIVILVALWAMGGIKANATSRIRINSTNFPD